MAEDGFPGREFRGYIKAEEPLKIKQSSFDLTVPKEEEDAISDEESSTLDAPKKKIPFFSFLKKRKAKKDSKKQKSQKRKDLREIKRTYDDPNKRQASEVQPLRPHDSELESSESSEQESSESSSTETKESEKEIDSLLEESSSSIQIPEELVRERFKSKSHRVEGYRRRDKGILKWFFRCSPCISKLLFSKRTQYRAIKGMFGFPIGLIFGYILQKIIIERLRLNPFSTRISGMILMLWMGIGYAISTQVRCICFLTIPSLCGKTGRAYINTFILTMIITGPLENIISNAKESTRVISCIASLNYNHTVKRFKLMFKPVKEIVWDLVGAGDKLKDGTKGFEGAYKEIEEEVHDEEEVKMAAAETQQLDAELGKESRVDTVKKKFSKMKGKLGDLTESKYGIKNELRCEGIFTKGVKACYNSFGAAYDRCHSYLPVIGYLLCWPMKLTFICDIAGAFMGKRACDSKDALSPGFGESMDTADEVQKEFDKEFGVQVHYKLDIPPEKVDQITPQDIGHSLKYQFEKKKRTLEFFLNLATRILTFTFIFVFQTSRKYCDQYLRNIEFDNRYITSYFRHIDERRKAQLMNSILLVGELLTASIILTFDWIFYEFLMLIQRHSQITYYQTGVHHIKMTVFGDGFVGTMVRSVLKGFDKKHKIDEFTTTAECLPRPTKLHSNSIIILYSTFLLIFALMFIETYALRLRRAICRFFFPKREKKRILFLYNDWLKKRNAYMRFMRHRVRKRARDQALALDSGVFLSLRLLYPRYFGWLGKLGFGKKKCLVCEEVESRKRPFIVCSKECPFCYCPECWKDMQGKCYVCLPDDDEDSPLSDEDFDDEDA